MAVPVVSAGYPVGTLDSNAGNANIAYPSFDVPSGGCLLVAAFLGDGATVLDLTSFDSPNLDWTHLTGASGLGNNRQVDWYWSWAASPLTDEVITIDFDGSSTYGRRTLVLWCFDDNVDEDSIGNVAIDTTAPADPSLAITATGADSYLLAAFPYRSAGGDTAVDGNTTSEYNAGTGGGFGFSEQAGSRISSGAGALTLGWTGDDVFAIGPIGGVEVKPSAGGASAALTGTGASGMTEADVVAGNKTLILTLTGDTYVAAGGTFDAIRQDIIDGLDSAQSEGTGWNAEVRDNLAVGAVVRTSATVVTITLSAQAAYNITATETITVTIPASALTLAAPLVAAPTFTVLRVAVDFRSIATSAFATAANITGTEPAGAALNDILVATLFIEPHEVVTPPSGWSNVIAGTTMMTECTTGAVYRQYTYWIRRGASAPDLTWLFASAFRGISISAYKNARTTGDPFSFGAVAFRDNTASRNYPDISGTTLVAEELLIWDGMGLDPGGAGTPPTGFTDERSDLNPGQSDKLQISAGATGTITGASYSGGTANPTSVHFMGLMPPATLATQTPRLNAKYTHFWGGR